MDIVKDIVEPILGVRDTPGGSMKKLGYPMISEAAKRDLEIDCLRESNKEMLESLKGLCEIVAGLQAGILDRRNEEVTNARFKAELAIRKAKGEK